MSVNKFLYDAKVSELRGCVSHQGARHSLNQGHANPPATCQPRPSPTQSSQGRECPSARKRQDVDGEKDEVK
ncbi:hypothetical protein E2C01_075260 [Portunus trituberculatus]|uniref:Uncharacterized protein n=1 Tax=Portunus trituberculatus TaxID=210409 RepID=A0A5B7IJL9_PORTR|nr:hypothetical protein [Portunus trituberculatus]